MFRKVSMKRRKKNRSKVAPGEDSNSESSPVSLTKNQIEQIIEKFIITPQSREHYLNNCSDLPFEDILQSYSEQGNFEEDYYRQIAYPHHMTELPKNLKTPFAILHPNGRLKSTWGVILAFLLMYTATIMPFSMAFVDSSGYDTWFFIDTIIDLLFFFDILINSCSAYYDTEGKLLVNRVKIILNYLKSWMIIDIMACIPFSLIDGNSSQETSGTSGYNSLIRLLRIPRLYRLFRITKLIKMIKHYKSLEFLEKLQDFLSIKQSYMRLLSSFMTILLLVHLMSCFWYFVAKLEGFHYDTWVMRYNYMDTSTGTKYIASIYWSITTITTVGYGDIAATTNLERILACSWMIFGLYFFSFTISSLTSVVAAIDSKENALTTKLAIIDEFSVEACLNEEIHKKLKHAIRYASEKKGYSILDKQDILSELPKKLRYQVALNMHQGAAKTLPFFNKLDKLITATIVPLLQPLFVEEKKHVYYEEEFADEIFFINRGSVQLQIDEGNAIVKNIRSKNYFGDIEVLLGLKRKTHAVAIKDCDLLIMNQHIIHVIRIEFKQLWKEMKEMATKNEFEVDKAIVEIKLVERIRNGELIMGKDRFKETVTRTLNEIHHFPTSEQDKSNEVTEIVHDMSKKLDRVLESFRNK